MKKKRADWPKSPSTTLDVPLYPRSATLLLDILEAATTPEAKLEGEPKYVLIDICNFRNQLAAHLQRVALGE